MNIIYNEVSPLRSPARLGYYVNTTNSVGLMFKFWYKQYFISDSVQIWCVSRKNMGGY